MNIKNFLDEALVKGENLKDEIAGEILKAKVVKDLLGSDLFAKAVSTVLKTKDEVTRVLKHNVKTMMQAMDIPSRNEISSIERKIDQLEKVIDRIGKKAITVKSLKTIQQKKSSK